MNENFFLDNLNLSGCSQEVVEVFFEPFSDVGECAFYLVQYDGDAPASSNEIGREKFEHYPAPPSGGIGSGGEKNLIRSSDKVLLYPKPNECINFHYFA